MFRGEVLKLPPFVDLHVHCREPGDNKAETIASATEAAADGGVGAINDMSNNAPVPTSTLEALEDKHERASNNSVIAFGAAMGVQPEYDNVGQIEAMSVKALLAKVYLGKTTNIDRVTDYEAHEFDEILDEIKRVEPDMLVVVHSGQDNYRDFIGHAAGDRGLRVHLTHVNKMDQVYAVEEAKAKGWDVEAGICAHHMLLTDHDRMTRSAFADMQPPLVDQDQANQLFIAYADGRIATHETDHAPHPVEGKMDAIYVNPRCKDGGPRCCGLPTLDQASKVLLWQVHIGNLSLERLVDSYSTRPAERLRLKIAHNSKVSWEMQVHRIDNEAKQVKSLSGWSPFLGMMAMGVVRSMRLSGQLVYENGKVINPARQVLMGTGEVI